MVHLDPYCLENLSILEVQKVQLVQADRIILEVHWVLAGQSIQLHSIIKYKQHNANVYRESNKKKPSCC